MEEVRDKQTVKIKKLLNLVSFLTNNSLADVPTACEIFGLNRRQLKHMINEIIMVGLPQYGPGDYIDAGIEGDRIWIANSDWLQEPLELTAEEAVSLKLMIRNVIRRLPGVYASAAAALEARLPEVFGHDAEGTAQAARPDCKIYVIRRALEESRVLEIEYYDRDLDETTVRQVEPYYTVDWAGTTCLAAHCRYKKWRTRFPIAQILKVRLLDERFEREADFSRRLWERVKGSDDWPHSGMVTVCFDRERAGWARERYEDAEVTEQPDGSVLCGFRSVDLHQLSDMIAEFEAEVTVTGPAGLRRGFNAHLESMEKLYE